MKYKKTIILEAGILLTTILATCGNQSDNNSQKSSSITQSSRVKTENKKQNSTNISNSSIDNSIQSQNSSINQNNTISNNSNKVNQSKISSNKNSNSNPTQPQNTNLTVQQLGTLACLYNRPAWFNTYINNDLWYGTINTNTNAGNIAGYHYITANGDPTSWLYYKQVGNNVILKYIDPNVTPVYKAPMVQEVVPISKLINNYYNNADKQKQVNNYANQLKPYSYNYN